MEPAAHWVPGSADPLALAAAGRFRFRWVRGSSDPLPPKAAR